VDCVATEWKVDWINIQKSDGNEIEKDKIVVQKGQKLIAWLFLSQ